MKGFNGLVLGIFGTLAFSWLGLAFIPNLQIGHLEPQTDEEGKDPYPAPKSGMAERGRRVYIANGCFYCHSQQVRADYAGSDIDRKWGQRRSAPRDYIFDRPVELGRLRMGPDLANIGHRAPSEDQNVAPGASPGAPNTPGAPAPASASPAPSAGGGAPANAPSVATASPGGASPGGKPSPPGNASPAASAPASASANANASPSGASPGAKPSGGGSAPPGPTQSPPPQGQSATPSPAVGNVAAKSTSSPGQSPAGAGAANAAVAGASPGVQQSVSSLGGTATSLEMSTSSSPPPYSAAWHHVHLYAPRSVNLDSNMPSYAFLYRKRSIGGQPSAAALKLRGEDAPPEGWEIIPTFDADCLVAYLMSLDQSHALKEVKAAPPPQASPSPGKSAQ